jgi:hypothetical protein
MSSGGLECRCQPCGGCRCSATLPHCLLNCCFPCLPLLTKLTVIARQQALNRTDTMGQAKPKRVALLSMLFLVASEVIDCGSDVVVYLNTVRPPSQRAIISTAISESFISTYLLMLVLSLLVSSVVLLARLGFIYCIAHKRGKVEKEEEYLLTTLNELCGLFVLFFEDFPFIILNCILIYHGHQILGCPPSPSRTLHVFDGGGGVGSTSGVDVASGPSGPIALSETLASISISAECDQAAANQRLRELMVSFSISAVCVSDHYAVYLCSWSRHVWLAASLTECNFPTPFEMYCTTTGALV